MQLTKHLAICVSFTCERIAQLVFVPVIVPSQDNTSYNAAWNPPTQVATLADLGETQRGASGHGSSGRV